jgi:Leucine-rich repeat (LRR) protein
MTSHATPEVGAGGSSNNYNNNNNNNQKGSDVESSGESHDFGEGATDASYDPYQAPSPPPCEPVVVVVKNDDHDHDHDHDDNSIMMIKSDHLNPSLSGEGSLPPVASPSLLQVVLSQNDIKKQRRELRNLSAVFSLAAAVLLLCILVPLGIAIEKAVADNQANNIIINNNSNNNNTDNTTEAPTMAPTFPVFPISILPNDTQASLEDPMSPQSDALEWILDQDPDLVSSLPEWRKIQLFALLTINYAFHGPPWPTLKELTVLATTVLATTAKSAAEPDLQQQLPLECHWVSVHSCDSHGRVLELVMDGIMEQPRNQSHGVPPELGLLTALTSLEISRYHNVMADDNVSLTEFLPSRYPPNLQRLVLSQNQLVGTIPTTMMALWGNLTYLDFMQNRLSGPIPTQLAQLTQLQSMSLQGNRLSSPIPSELGLLRNLTLLQLNQNQLSSTLPTELGQLVNLQLLLLSDNRLQETIPSQWGSMLTSLVQLSAGNNSLLGPIPSELGLLSNRLVFLELDHNSFEGCIPSELGTMTRIRSLLIGHNNLACGLPAELGMLSSSLRQLDVSYNAGLDGILPTQLFFGKVFTVDFRGTNLSLPPEEEIGCCFPTSDDDDDEDDEDASVECPCTVTVANGTATVTTASELTMANRTANMGTVNRTIVNQSGNNQSGNIFRHRYDDPIDEQEDQDGR